MPQIDSPARAIARNVLVIVGVLLILYIIYLLRKPISWLIIAAFLAIAVAGPVNFFQRYMKRGLAIALTYLCVLAIPIGLGAVLIPPIVNQVSDVATNAPSYVNDVEDYVQKNKTLNDLNEKYDITQKLSDEADEAAEQGRRRREGAARHRLRTGQLDLRRIDDPDPEHLHGGRRAAMDRELHPDAETGARGANRADPAPDRERGRQLRRRRAAAGDDRGLAAFIMLKILGVPFAGPLAVVIFVFDLIPVVGATIGAVLVGIVTAFVNFPVALIIWVVFAIVYQQVENYVIQPQIQKRATKVEAFIILVAVLFGSTLFGVLGAILAVPFAASIQIGVAEYLEFRREVAAAEQEAGGPTPAPPPEGPTPAPEAT